MNNSYEKRRLSLGSELRQFRIGKGLTGTAAAERIGISQSKLSKIESHALLPTANDLDALCELYGVTKSRRKGLLELLRMIRTEYSSWRFENRQGISVRQSEIGRIEQSASVIRIFQVAVIPGLLQLPAYAECVIRASNITAQTDFVQAAENRIKRQSILYDPKKAFEFLVSEAALFSRFCPAEIVIQQLHYLAAVDDFPNVTLGVVPNTIKIPSAPLNSFIVIDKQMVWIETTAGMLSLADERDIKSHLEIFERFLICAKKRDEAKDFIRDCALTLSHNEDVRIGRKMA